MRLEAFVRQLGPMKQSGTVTCTHCNACRQKEGARRADEAAKRAREAEAERARRAAYSEALRREAARTAAILAKQVTLQPLRRVDKRNAAMIRRTIHCWAGACCITVIALLLQAIEVIAPQRRAASSVALRREATCTAAILAKQVTLQPLCDTRWDEVMQCLAGCVLLDAMCYFKQQRCSAKGQRMSQ